jgi:hypothetical protein
MKLIEREKKYQHMQMQQRLRKLEIDNNRAKKQLKATMEAHDRAEAVA